MPINRKHYHPQLPNTYKSLKSSDFLSGKLKTFYGPGQNPDAGEPDLYTNPTKWPKNIAIRVPQVVNLYLSRPTINTAFSRHIDAIATGPTRSGLSQFFNIDPQIWSMDYFGDGSLSALAYVKIGFGFTSGQDDPYPMTLGAWSRISSLDFPGYKVWYYNQGSVELPTQAGTGLHTPFTATIDDPFPDEYNRIKDMFVTVKSKIEKIRPNRTWINILDPWNYTSNPPIHKYFLNDALEYWPMISPVYDKTYFGTNFLHLHIGGPDTTKKRINDATSSHDEIYISRDNSFALIPNVLIKYPDYGFRYFGIKASIPDIPPYNGTGSVPPAFQITISHDSEQPKIFIFSSRTVADGSSEAIVGYWNSPFNSDPSDGAYAAAAAQQNIDINITITEFNDANSEGMDANIEQLKTDETDLKAIKINVKYVADSDAISGVDYLINFIANYYKFNPEKGTDL